MADIRPKLDRKRVAEGFEKLVERVRQGKLTAEIMEPFEFPEVNEGVKKALEILRQEWDGCCLVVFLGDMKPRAESSAEIVGRIIRDHDAVLRVETEIRSAQEAPIIYSLSQLMGEGAALVEDPKELLPPSIRLPPSLREDFEAGKKAGAVVKKEWDRVKKDRPKTEKRRRGPVRKI